MTTPRFLRPYLLPRLRRWSLCLALASASPLALAPMAVAAQEAQAHAVDIAAQPLPQALAQFSLQTKIQIIYAVEAPYGLSAPAVRGRFSQGEILSRLLAGSGLSWREVRPGVVSLETAPKAQGAVVVDALRVQGALGDTETLSARDALAYDAIYDLDGSSTYAGRAVVERYKGVSPSDVLKGMVNVYSGDARNSGALDPNIRGVGGPGRAPVIIDGGEQALTVWRGYNGANNRSYIDPSLIGGLQVLKGPSLTGGVHSSTAGAVIVTTLAPRDILREGQRYGAEVRVEGGNNSVKPRLPTLLTGQDYRTVPGFPGSPGVVGFPSSPYDDPYVQVTPKTAADNDALSLGDRSVRMAVAGRTDALEWLAAYAWRERGNYYAGETEADFYSQTNLPTPSGPQDLLKRLAFNYRPGNEAPNTSSEMSSWLGKLVWKISDRQALELGVRDSVTTYGEVMPSRIISTTSNGMGKVQWPLSEVHAAAYNLDYRLRPQGQWIDLKTTLWLTRTNSHTYTAGGFPNWAQNAANPILKNTALSNAKNDRYGVSASNKMRLTPQLDLILAGDWQHEKLKSPDVWAGTFDGWKQYPRAGRREEYNLHANAEWRPISKITLAAGARYSHYWAFDDFLDTQIKAGKGSQFTSYVFTDAEVIYRTLVNGRTVNNTVPWLRDSEGRFTRVTDPCVNGFLATVANATGYCSAIVNQGPMVATSYTKRGDSWAPVASATFNITPQARTYVRYAEAYRFPSLFESTIGFSASTPAKPLKPEHARTWEAAYVHDLSSLLSLPEGQRADVKLTYFRNDTRNVIERSTQLLLSNLEKQIIEGLEFQARYDNGRLFADVSASHTLKNKACDPQAAILKAPMTGIVPDCVNYGFVGGYLLTQATPTDSVYLNLGGRFLQRRLEVGVRGTYYSAYDNPELERFIGGPRAGRVDGYASNTPYIWGEIITVDAYANFKLNDKIRFELTGTNLNDRYYTDPLTRTAQPAPGRTLKLSMTARY